MRNQQLQRRFATKRRGQVQGTHAMAVARIGIHAECDQAFDQGHPTQPHRQRERRVARG